MSTVRRDHRRPRGPRPAATPRGGDASRRALCAGTIALLAFPVAPSLASMLSPLLKGPGGPSASSLVLLVPIAGFCAAVVYGIRALRAVSACLCEAGVTAPDRGRAVLGMVLGAGVLAVEPVLVIAVVTGNFNP